VQAHLSRDNAFIKMPSYWHSVRGVKSNSFWTHERQLVLIYRCYEVTRPGLYHASR